MKIEKKLDRQHTFFATCAKNIEGLLKQELINLGALNVKETVLGVYFEGDLTLAYKICLWSRLANHIFMPILKLGADSPEDLYQKIYKLDWSLHLDPAKTLAVEVSGRHETMTNNLFIAQKVKDAVVDKLRAQYGQRPSVQKHQPDLNLNLHIERGIFCTLSLNLSGESLHRRGYRLEAGRAPLKETLAAAILIRAGWKGFFGSQADAYESILDPMCGTGTLLIEAALIKFNIAPGLFRNYFGFLGWKQHQRGVWETLVQEAKKIREENLLPVMAAQKNMFLGLDIHPDAVRFAKENIKRAGLSALIKIQQQDCLEYLNLENNPSALELVNQDGGKNKKLIIFNPPYGERLGLGEMESLKQLFTACGTYLRKYFIHADLAIFSGAPKEIMQALGIRAVKKYPLLNGLLPCELYLFKIQPELFWRGDLKNKK